MSEQQQPETQEAPIFIVTSTREMVYKLNGYDWTLGLLGELVRQMERDGFTNTAEIVVNYKEGSVKVIQVAQ